MTEWGVADLGDLVETLGGLWTGKKGPMVTCNVLRNTNFTREQRLDFDNVAVLDVEARQFAKRELRRGDIILEKSGGGPKQPVGRVVLFDREEANYSYSNFTNRLRIKNPNQLLPEYLHWFLTHFYFKGGTEPIQSNSTSIRNLNMPEYLTTQIPLPPLDEQKRIVAKLDAFKSQIDRIEVLGAKSSVLAKDPYQLEIRRIFRVNNFGWPTTTLGESCSYRNGKAHEPFLDKDGEFRLVTSKFVSTEGLSARRVSSALTPLGKDDVAFVLSDLPNGRALGKAFLVKDQIDLTLNQRVMAINSIKFDANFLFHQINRHPHLLQFNNGESQTHLKLAQVMACPLVCPPLKEQREFGKYLTLLDHHSKRYIALQESRTIAIKTLQEKMTESLMLGKL